MLLCGAFFKSTLPQWIPYTVFILLICILMGYLGHTASESASCPWHAYKFAGADGKVSRAEWGTFLCEGCHASSYCLSTTDPFSFGWTNFPRTCGDGSIESSAPGATGKGEEATPRCEEAS